MHDKDKPKVQKSANKQDNAPVGALTLDCDLYQHHLDESDLSDAQKQEFLETLWSIVVSFVDLGIGIHPVQDAMPDEDQDTSTPICGQNFDLGKYLASETLNVVKSPDQPTMDKFKQAADRSEPSDDNRMAGK